MEGHLAEESLEEGGNRRNGVMTKTMKTGTGSFELDVPRDRNSTFEPQLIKKRQTILTEELDKVKILALYGLGTSYEGIMHHLQEIYGVDVSAATISTVTDKLVPLLNEWRARPLESVYAIVFLDAMYFKVRQDNKVTTKVIYNIMGISQSGLKGFPEGITTAFPRTEVQLCIVHQIRNSLKHVASKNQKEFMVDLKTVYQASNKEIAANNLLQLDEKWDNLTTYFKYSDEVRKLIYTTNPIEGFHRQVRKYTKTKGSFTSENALFKLVFCAIKQITAKWTMPVPNWALTLSQLDIYFPDRLLFRKGF
jgi:putative transposase